MAPKKTVDLTNFEALGTKRLAEILLELSAEDAGIKRRLRLELSAEAGAEAVAADIGKRLSTLRQARSFIDWPKRRAFVKDLDLDPDASPNTRHCGRRGRPQSAPPGTP